MTELEETQRLKRAASLYGYKKEVNPYVTLLDEVKWRAGHVEKIRERLAEMSDEELWVINLRGEEVPAPILRRYDKERDMLDRVAKLAIDAGISERYVNLAELQGHTLMTALNEAFDDPDVALTDGQRSALGGALQRAFKKVQGDLERQQVEGQQEQQRQLNM